MGIFEQRLHSLRYIDEQAREGKDGRSRHDIRVVTYPRQEFFSPVFSLFGRMHTSGIKFPAGPVPDEQTLRALAPLEPDVSIKLTAVDMLWVTLCLDKTGLAYAAWVQHETETGLQVITNDMDELENWLANLVYQYEVPPPPLVPPPRDRLDESGRSRVVDIGGRSAGVS